MPRKPKKTPCEKCPLYDRKAQFFTPPISEIKNPQWMIITEGSVPKAMEVLMKFIVRYGRPLITQAVKCHCGPEPPVKAISLCREAYLEDEIKNFKGRKVVLLGGVAIHSIYRGKRKLRELIGIPLREGTKQFLSVWNPNAFFLTGNKQILTDIERAVKWAIAKIKD